ncbi:MAG TPA: YCF48-related protein [Povalibacter sp.]|uniref:WD40/YVTN/BNR-like repeat-containing protein n=1 Tax=Povalibacter sp. TaxID=1962978 RepID=UPI002C77B63C|nr:YCF48-related protein [Povalibacter sp.]HMN43790.1 YCF48-related protein [Povalibacter sp.]
MTKTLAAALLCGCAMIGGVAIATAQGVPADSRHDPLQRAALQAPRAAHGVMLAVAVAGQRMVAAGERGIVLWSDDGARQWHQAQVPVSVTLTALSFPSPQQGWAVGHGGAVLHSTDGGKRWKLQLDGRAAAQIELNAARASDDARRIALARQLVSDGPDKPLLGVHFWNERRGFVIGAYGLIFGTEDGGATWSSWAGRVDNPRGLHLNALYAGPSAVFLVGEQGLVLRSTDDARSFHRLTTPYNGSWFAVTGRDDVVLIGGLRGHVSRSTDGGDSWTAARVPMPVTIGAASATRSSFIIINQAGALMTSDDGSEWRPMLRPTGPPLTALAVAPEGDLLVASFAGAMRLSNSGS